MVVAHRLRCSVACRFFLDKGSKLCFLHWQADSLPQSHRGSPQSIILFFVFYLTPLGFVCLISSSSSFFLLICSPSCLLQIFEYFMECHLIFLLAIYSPSYYFYGGCDRDYNTHSWLLTVHWQWIIYHFTWNTDIWLLDIPTTTLTL